MPVRTIYLLRHGQTDFNVQGIVQGSGVDASLNDTGRRQAAQFFATYRHVPFAKVYTSALRRSQESVQAFLDLGLPHESHAALNEISWGTREGTRITPDEDDSYHHLLADWAAGHTAARLDGGESAEDVAARQRPFVELLKSRTNENPVLICMHGRAMRVLLCLLLHYPLRCMEGFAHHNLGLYRLEFTGTAFTVRNFLDVEHLSE